MHLRTAGIMAAFAKELYKSYQGKPTIFVSVDSGRNTDARDILSLLILEVTTGKKLEIKVTGELDEPVLAEIAGKVAEKFRKID